MIESILSLVSFLIGSIIVWYLQKNKYEAIINTISNEANIKITSLKDSLDRKLEDEKILLENKIEDKALISKLSTKLSEQQNSMDEKLNIVKDNEERLKQEFENLANKIFDNSSKKFTEQNKTNIDLILNPMRQQISEFKKKVEDVYDKESKDRNALTYELKILKELNQKMSIEASNLTNALNHDNKTQGGWGEIVLDKVLENSGLRENYEFKKQVSLRDNQNRLFQPDVVLYLPDNRNIIIDAKTSLTAYNNYMSCDTQEKELYLKQHLKSVKGHINELSDKKYEDLEGINSLDFIFMFMPIESALLIALENDVNLYDYAFKQKIILVSPTTLLVALRAVENTWRYEKQAQSISKVYKRAEELYSKFNGFVDDLQKAKKGLDMANDSYKNAFNKLSKGNGNLIGQVEKLKLLSNIKPKKELDDSLVQGAMVE